jgi:hypothetical protein
MTAAARPARVGSSGVRHRPDPHNQRATAKPLGCTPGRADPLPPGFGPLSSVPRSDEPVTTAWSSPRVHARKPSARSSPAGDAHRNGPRPRLPGRPDAQCDAAVRPHPRPLRLHADWSAPPPGPDPRRRPPPPRLSPTLRGTALPDARPKRRPCARTLRGCAGEVRSPLAGEDDPARG